MELHMINIIYAALPMCAQTEKTTFSCKDDCKQTSHTRRWAYSTLWYLSFLKPLYGCCMSLAEAYSCLQVCVYNNFHKSFRIDLRINNFRSKRSKYIINHNQKDNLRIIIDLFDYSVYHLIPSSPDSHCSVPWCCSSRQDPRSSSWSESISDMFQR